MAGRRSWKVGSLPIRKAAELYHVHGWSSYEVAREAGVGHWAVLKAFSRYRIPARQGTKVLREDLSEARARGWTKVKLARNLGVTENAIYKAQRRLRFSWPERDRVELPR